MAKKKLPDVFGDDGDQAVLAPPSAPTVGVPATHYRDTRGVALLDAHVTCTSVDEFASEITRLWDEAQHRFVEIGRYLNEAKTSLGHGRFLPMVESQLPFGIRVAQKLMQVAEAIDSEILPPERLPPSYNTVYELVTLKEEERAIALERNIVRPDVKRDEVIEFKRKLRAKPQLPEQERKKLKQRLERLRTQRQRLEQEIADLVATLGDEDGEE